MPTSVTTQGGAYGSDNLWRHIKEEDGVFASCKLDFSTLDSELSLGADGSQMTKVGGFIMNDVKGAMKEAGYILKKNCPVGNVQGNVHTKSSDLFNPLAIGMTISTGLLIIILLVLLYKRK